MEQTIRIKNATSNISGNDENFFSGIISGEITDITADMFGNASSIRGAGFYASSITSCDTGNIMTVIGGSAFKNCWYLKSITIGENIERIAASETFRCVFCVDRFLF